MIIQAKLSTVGFITICLLIAAVSSYAQDPGDMCDPDVSIGHTARLAATSGTVNVYDSQGKQMQVGPGSVIPPGAKIETGPDGTAELALEDGTKDRLSRIRLDPGTRAVVSGGLYCSDLRPKADEGRWSAREAGIELLQGRLVIELAAGVSHSYNLEVKSPNSVARMVRGTQDKMNAEFYLTGLDDRQLVSPVDHPRIQSQIAGLLMGRSIDDLTPREREGVTMQAAMAAFGMGLIDMEAEGLLENPQIRSMMEMMTRGRDLSDLDENERNMVMQGVVTMAIQQGLVNPETLKVYDQPDESTRVTVHAGRMRVHNRHRGYDRNETVQVESGMFSDVKGYEVPTPPRGIQ
ncbi:MAG: hypothetical protein R6U22_11655 [Desulfohalobiaceae bacterium]